MNEADYERDESGRPLGTGCCSAYAFPPLVVLLLAVSAVMLALRMPADAPPASAASIVSRSAGVLSSLFTPEVQHWATAIADWSATAGLDPNLVATVLQIESCGDPRALSRAGAMGLFQVMPFHFASTDDPFAPDTNAARGLAYLARALASAQGEARLALAGYNGGIGVIAQPEWAWPDETVRYAYWGAGIYADASSGSQSSGRLQEWLAAGGASLCRSASERLRLPR